MFKMPMHIFLSPIEIDMQNEKKEIQKDINDCLLDLCFTLVLFLAIVKLYTLGAWIKDGSVKLLAQMLQYVSVFMNSYYAYTFFFAIGLCILSILILQIKGVCIINFSKDTDLEKMYKKLRTMSIWAHRFCLLFIVLYVLGVFFFV